MVWFVIGVYKIDRTLHGRLKIWNIFSCAGECLFIRYAYSWNIFLNIRRDISYLRAAK